MENETVVPTVETVAPAAPPVEPTPAQQLATPQFTFLSDEITRADFNKDSLSLPNPQGLTVAPVTTPQTQTVPTDAPIASSNNEGVTTPQETVIIDPTSVDFSQVPPVSTSTVGVDGTINEPAQEGFVPPVGSPLDATAPKWQHDAYQRVADDTSLSDDEKKVITSLPPQQWDRAKEWQKSNKMLGKFRDTENVPVEQTVELLERQSPERLNQILLHGVNRVIADDQFNQQFAAQHKETYVKLIQHLTQVNPEFTASVLARSGYVVEKAKSFDKEAALDSVRSDPSWALIEGTELGDALIRNIEERAKSQPQTVTTEELVEELNKQDNTAKTSPMLPPEVRQTAFNTYREVEQGVFLSAVAQGLQASGVRLPTENEWKINPEACATMANAYYLALEGGGDIPSWDEQSAVYCKQIDGFDEKVTALQSLFTQQKFDDFKSMSRSLDPYYYEFGKKRAGIGRVRASYDAALKRLKETVSAQTITQQPTTPQTQAVGNGNGVQQPQVLPQTQTQTSQAPRFLSDALFKESWQKNKMG